jgi:hypothetical protein
MWAYDSSRELVIITTGTGNLLPDTGNYYGIRSAPALVVNQRRGFLVESESGR